MSAAATSRSLSIRTTRDWLRSTRNASVTEVPRVVSRVRLAKSARTKRSSLPITPDERRVRAGPIPKVRATVYPIATKRSAPSARSPPPMERRQVTKAR